MVREVLPEHVGVAGPVLRGGRAEHGQDGGELVRLVEAGEERLAGDELGQDAAAAPDVHRGGVGGAQQHLRGAVPQGHHLVSGLSVGSIEYFEPLTVDVSSVLKS